MPRPTVAEIHEDISARFAKRVGRFQAFFLNWIKFQSNGDRLYQAVGEAGETYLQYRLSLGHVVEAQGILQVVLDSWQVEKPQRVYDYLNHEDADGNGIWHYLADTLRDAEGIDTLKMARTLLSLDVDFSKRNKFGISPLCKMLVPEPRWRSVNALIQTKHLSIENIERALGETAKDDEKKAAMMSALFKGDLTANRGLLSQHVLKQSLAPQADRAQRDATCRLFFDYIDPRDGSSAFFKLIAVANHGMFEDLLRLLMRSTEETVLGMGPPDVVTKKAYRQVLICKKLLRRDRSGEGILFKGLQAGKHQHLRKLCSLLLNDEVCIKKLVRGEPVRQPIPIDPSSPAPTNPLLSILLQRDGDGNTVFHHAMLAGDQAVLEGFFYGLPSNDIYAIITGVANGCGITLLDLTDPEAAKSKLVRAVKIGLLAKARGQAMLGAIDGITPEVAGYVVKKIDEIESLASDTKGGRPVPPNFDLSKFAASLSATASAAPPGLRAGQRPAPGR
jgi:hypothetical protein